MDCYRFDGEGAALKARARVHAELDVEDLFTAHRYDSHWDLFLRLQTFGACN